MTSGDPQFDPYKTLQVDPEAEDEVIEAAYRRLARKYHPDVADGPDAQARMVAFNRAWELLRDPARRARVDRARAAAAARGTWAPRPSAPEPPPGWATRTPPAASPPPPRAPRDAARGGTMPGSGDGGQRAPGWTSSTGFDAFSDAVRREAGGARGPQQSSPDWSAGRSFAGSGYDPATMRSPDGTGAAGRPPGNPSGSVLGFGRYEGWSLGEVARTDLEYLEWLDRMPIGRAYQGEIDVLLRAAGRRRAADGEKQDRRGLFRR